MLRESRRGSSAALFYLLKLQELRTICIWPFFWWKQWIRIRNIIMVKRGNIKVEAKFNASLSAPIHMVVFEQFDKLIQIDKYRNVSLDYKCWRITEREYNETWSQIYLCLTGRLTVIISLNKTGIITNQDKTLNEDSIGLQWNSSLQSLHLVLIRLKDILQRKFSHSWNEKQRVGSKDWKHALFA